ncbi:hypothetical protein FM112_01805 [Gulosibacter sp. 10]|nr:hypothetical protein FM112_01805 [Gulosibacter sp. 10]
MRARHAQVPAIATSPTGECVIDEEPYPGFRPEVLDRFEHC